MKNKPHKINKIQKDIDEIHIDEIHIDEIFLNSKSNISDSKNNKADIIAFWRPNDQYEWLGQWYVSDFRLTEDIIAEFPQELKELDLYVKRFDVLEKLSEQEKFNTAEKFMMMGKAALFRDKYIFDAMSHTDSPKEQKRLGQRVRNFNEGLWKLYCKDIVSIGNYLKFNQDNTIKKKLINTQNAILVEGSPLDKIWGVGLRFDDPRIKDNSKWKGLNYLGECLMVVRDLLKNELRINTT